MERILSDKAVKADVMSRPNYYDVLYAFYVFRGNYRAGTCPRPRPAPRRSRGVTRLAAGLAMCDLAGRLAIEGPPGAASFQGQARCYAAALSALHLVDPRYAWKLDFFRDEVRGRPHESCCWRYVLTRAQPLRASPKRKRTPAASLGEALLKRDASVLSLEDIERLYLLSLARLRLLSVRPRRLVPSSSSALRLPQRSRDLVLPPGTSQTTASDTFALLVQNGCYDSALSLAKYCVPFSTSSYPSSASPHPAIVLLLFIPAISRGGQGIQPAESGRAAGVRGADAAVSTDLRSLPVHAAAAGPGSGGERRRVARDPYGGFWRPRAGRLEGEHPPVSLSLSLA